VYDKDPAKYPDAVKISAMTYQEAVSNDAISVMDKAALGLAMEQHQPLIVFDAMKPDAISHALSNDPIGTRIS
jgi:uridylate kinase